MNELENYLHYRSVDVSSLKELCRRWYPDVYSKRPNKTEQHRALDDIRESIEELRFYRDELFRAGAAAAPSPPAP
jgi:oligoribonuclease